MAIIKHIELGNGIPVNYHRVVSVNNITNVSSIIEIASYTDKSKREEEKAAIESGREMNVFINTEYINLPYDNSLNVVTAYEHIKSQERYGGGIDD